MSRKRSSSGDSGCLVALFPLILVLGIIGTVLEFIAENIGIILIVLAVVGAIIGIVVAINNATKKKEAEEAEKQRNRAIINAPETKPSLTNIPTSSSFANKEEESAAMTIRLDYVGADNKAEKKASTTLGDYEQTKVASWPAVTKIKSVFDAVIGVTSDGKMFVDGFCPCSEADLMRIMGLNE